MSRPIEIIMEEVNEKMAKKRKELHPKRQMVNILTFYLDDDTEEKREVKTKFPKHAEFQLRHIAEANRKYRQLNEALAMR